MSTIANVVVGLVAVLHIYFLVLEMFLWDKPAGLRAFGQTPEQAAASKVLAANQGLYNGFLAAGLIWSVQQSLLEYVGKTNFVPPPPEFALQLKCFFLGCVIVAALYGAYSVKMRILWLQGGPAAAALVVTLLS